MNRDAKATYAVLEEIMRRAMDEALTLRSQDVLSSEDEAALMAYFNILDWGKQEAETHNVKFGDRELQAFDPYSLLRKKAA